jgi:electron-transferring-flavoprotein dehydrogenase
VRTFSLARYLSQRALNELFPNWKADGAPLETAVTGDDIYMMLNDSKPHQSAAFAVPKTMHNEGNYIISLGRLCRWLAEQAEALGVEIFPGFAAAEVLYHDNGSVKGIITGDMGVGHDGQPTDGYYTQAWNCTANTRCLPKAAAVIWANN